MTQKSYKDLIVWQKGFKLALAVYELTKSFPREEIFGLTSQMRRAAVSVTSNIAEGYGRNSNGDFYRFLLIARGSLLELENQLLIAENLKLVGKERFLNCQSLLVETSKLLYVFSKKVHESQSRH